MKKLDDLRVGPYAIDAQVVVTVKKRLRFACVRYKTTRLKGSITPQSPIYTTSTWSVRRLLNACCSGLMPVRSWHVIMDWHVIVRTLDM